MARYNKIYAGPFTEATPQVKELPAAVDILPGSLVVIAAGKFALATAATVGKMFVAQDNYLVMEGVETAIEADDVLIGMELMDQQFFNMRLSIGANVADGAALTPAAGGTLAIAGAADKVVGFADEAYNNTTGSVQLIRVRPANGYMTAA